MRTEKDREQLEGRALPVDIVLQGSCIELEAGGNAECILSRGKGILTS